MVIARRIVRNRLSVSGATGARIPAAENRRCGSRRMNLITWTSFMRILGAVLATLLVGLILAGYAGQSLRIALASLATGCGG
jgi:hypothetical protein